MAAARDARYTLQDEASKLMPWDKVRSCCRHAQKDKTSIEFHRNKKGKIKLKGLARCGSVWICPICSNIISGRRRASLQDALARAKKLNLNVAFITLTVRHNKGQLAKDLLADISKARRLLYNRKPWKRISESLDVVGSIRALEVNYNFTNGWHIHTHELIFYRGPEIKYQAVEDVNLPELISLRALKDFSSIASYPLQSRLALEWYSACKTAGLDLPDAHGVTVQPGHLAGAYASKWGMADELTASGAKECRTWRDTRKGVTPWQLLALSKAGDEEAGLRFVEYGESFRGRRQLVWSKGLSDLLSVVWIEDDQQILDLEDRKPSEYLGSLHYELWGDICSAKLRSEVLDVAEHWGWSGVEHFIEFYFPDSPEAKAIRSRERVEIPVSSPFTSYQEPQIKQERLIA